MWNPEPDPHVDASWIAAMITSRLVLVALVTLVAFVATLPPPDPPIRVHPDSGCDLGRLVFPPGPPPPPPPPPPSPIGR